MAVIGCFGSISGGEANRELVQYTSCLKRLYHVAPGAIIAARDPAATNTASTLDKVHGPLDTQEVECGIIGLAFRG